MKNFINHDFNITNIEFICHLETRIAKDQHVNIKHHTISFMPKGKVKYSFPDGTSGISYDNYVSFEPKGSTTYVQSLEPSTVFCIDFDLAEDFKLKRFATKIKNSSKLINMFLKANKLWSEKKPGYMMLCKAELYKILYTIQKELNSTYYPQAKQNCIQPAIDYIHSYYTNQTISVEHLAEICNISPSYLRRLFNNLYSVSPCEYINALKLSYAKELLKSNKYRIDDIAILSGYSSAPYFSREFKKATGFSPSEYIKLQK